MNDGQSKSDPVRGTEIESGILADRAMLADDGPVDLGAQREQAHQSAPVFFGGVCGSMSAKMPKAIDDAPAR